VHPVGLTRAEEAMEHPRPSQPRVAVPAPPGALRCRAPVPPDGGNCPAAATQVVGWPDGDRTPMCLECTLRTQQMAHSHQTRVKLEPIE